MCLSLLSLKLSHQHELDKLHQKIYQVKQQFKQKKKNKQQQQQQQTERRTNAAAVCDDDDEKQTILQQHVNGLAVHPLIAPVPFPSLAVFPSVPRSSPILPSNSIPALSPVPNSPELPMLITPNSNQTMTTTPASSSQEQPSGTFQAPQLQIPRRDQQPQTTLQRIVSSPQSVDSPDNSPDPMLTAPTQPPAQRQQPTHVSSPSLNNVNAAPVLSTVSPSPRNVIEPYSTTPNRRRNRIPALQLSPSTSASPPNSTSTATKHNNNNNTPIIRNNYQQD